MSKRISLSSRSFNFTSNENFAMFMHTCEKLMNQWTFHSITLWLQRFTLFLSTSRQLSTIMLFLLNIHFIYAGLLFFLLFHWKIYDRVSMPSLSRFELKLTKLSANKKRASGVVCAVFFLLSKTFSCFYAMENESECWVSSYHTTSLFGVAAREISSDSLRSDFYKKNELVLKTWFALVERSRCLWLFLKQVP